MEQRSAIRFLIGHLVFTGLLLVGAWFLARSSQTASLYVFGLPLRILDIMVIVNAKGGWESWLLHFYWFNLLVDILAPGLFAAALFIEMKPWKRFALGALILVLMALAISASDGARFEHEERGFKPLHWRSDQF
jgi:hypothetical protein